MQSFSRKTACANGKYEQEIGFIFGEPSARKRQVANWSWTLKRGETINDTKRGSKRKRTESKLEVPVDLRVGLRTYFIALMLEEKLFIMTDQSLCLFFRADRVIACLQRRRHACVVIDLWWLLAQVWIGMGEITFFSPQGCAQRNFEGSPLPWTCEIQSAHRNLKFSSHSGANVSCQGWLCTARTQPWVFSPSIIVQLIL